MGHPVYRKEKEIGKTYTKQKKDKYKQPPNYFQLGLRHSLGEMERYIFDMQHCNAIKKTNIPLASDSVSHLRTLLGELERYLPLAQVAFSNIVHVLMPGTRI